MAGTVFCNTAHLALHPGRTTSDTPHGGGIHSDEEKVHDFDPFDDDTYSYVPAVKSRMSHRSGLNAASSELGHKRW